MQTASILLLKNRSTPGDAYEDLFAIPHRGIRFRPLFAPVLEHHFRNDGLAVLESVIEEGRISPHDHSSYGGLIFTSQRAVEAFASVVGRLRGRGVQVSRLENVPIYSVGPATSRCLESIEAENPWNVFGSHTGNGRALASFILGHYAQFYGHRAIRTPLLFPVGEQRRDVIPKTLMSAAPESENRILVKELEVYATGVRESFEDSFKRQLEEVQTSGSMVWVVVFSPMGCEAMLRVIGLAADSDGAEKPGRPRGIFIATIGPTTRDHLKSQHGIEPDVCAQEPNPDSVLHGIVDFMLEHGLAREP